LVVFSVNRTILQLPYELVAVKVSCKILRYKFEVFAGSKVLWDSEKEGKTGKWSDENDLLFVN
jgi:hypothetical protein